jgi:hypothetical protein
MVLQGHSSVTDKEKKTVNPTMNKRGKMHSEVTSTPKKIMLEERREKRLIAQKKKKKRSTRQRKAAETKRK